MKQIQFKNFNEKNKNNRYYVNLKDNTYIFNVRWNEYAECAFLSISDYNNNSIIKGKALVNRLKIRNRLLPYVFVFLQVNGETYEPTLDIIAKEFMLCYEDGEDDG